MDLIFKKDPSLLTSIASARKVNLSSSFFLALSLQHDNYTPYINESNYEISANLISIQDDAKEKKLQ